MNSMDQALPVGVDRWARRAIVLVAVVTSLGLFLVREGTEFNWPGMRSPIPLTLLYTLLTALPTLIALLLSRAGDRVPWIAGLLYAIVLVPLALHVAHAAAQESKYGNGGLYFHYTLVLAFVSFVAAPFIQTWRGGNSALHYPALFEFAWSNALALVIATMFTLACWLILLLWQELFALIGIHFFRDLFHRAEFGYPASGLFIGIGLALGRTQANAVRTLLNICLTLGQTLFPLVAAVALLFLGALAANKLDPLWRTRHAAALLLTLVAVAVSSLNAVYQDGARPEVYKAPLRSLANLALLALPVFVGIAAYALWLRIAQHGWTEQREWATLVTAIAALYAGSYAVAVVWRRRPWLALVGPANSWIALATIPLLLLTQSPLLDFRAIAVRSQISRALAPDGDPSKLDLHYLRFEAGKPGEDALTALKRDPRVSTNINLVAAINDMLQQTEPYRSGAELAAALSAASFTVLPAGTAIPDSLLDAINRSHGKGEPFPLRPVRCAERPGHCVLLFANLAPNDRGAWVIIDADNWNWLPVFDEDAAGWKYRGTLMATRPDADHFAKDVQDRRFRVEASQWRELVIGDDAHYRFTPAQ